MDETGLRLGLGVRLGSGLERSGVIGEDGAVVGVGLKRGTGSGRLRPGGVETTGVGRAGSMVGGPVVRFWWSFRLCSFRALGVRSLCRETSRIDWVDVSVVGAVVVGEGG